MSEAGLSLLTERVEKNVVAPAAIVVKEGDIGKHLFIIGKGSVRVYKTTRHGELQLANLSEGDFFGEMCILEKKPRSATVETITETTLFRIPHLAFETLFREMPAEHSILVSNMARDLSSRLRNLSDIMAARH
jgi:CRP/FNR family transcriptional regulator, cyclic AMP receptor protein